MSHHEKPATTLTHEAVQAWLDAYLHAWETYDAADVEALFTEDAEYRYHPADEPEVGRELIVFGWLNPNGDASRRDAPGTWAGDYRAIRRRRQSRRRGRHEHLLDRRLALEARAGSTTTTGCSSSPRMARCSSFIEYFMVPRGS